LIPNEAYWGDVDLDGLALRFFASDNAMALAYRDGEIDAVGLISAESFKTLSTLPNIRFFSAPEPHTTHLIFNNEVGIAVDQRIREAIAHSIDRSALIDVAVAGQGVPFNGPFAPHNWAANPSFPLLATNAFSATTLLVEANWPLDEVSGARQRVKDTVIETLRLRLLSADTPRQQALATALQTQLALNAIAVEVDIQPVDTYRESLRSRAFDIAIVDVLPLRDPDLYDFWSQEAIVSGQNYAGWNNRRASEALEVARQLYEPEERFEYYAGFNGAFADDLPALGLYQAVQSYGVRGSVVAAGTGDAVVIGRISAPRDRYKTINDWRIKTAQMPVPCDPDQ
ncbi:MAG: ABC transporter substrate-binding protein, partial [Candidatus Promineifilaceae bacterium]